MHYRKGSLTIELALLMPCICAVFILIIFTGYYMYDKCVLQRAAYTAAGDKYPESRFDELTENALIGKWDLSVDVSENEEETSVHVTGTMRCIEGMFTDLLSNIVFSVDITESSINYSGSEYMRDR